MLIEIDESVVVKATSGDTVALLVLQMLATAQQKGYHIVWATRKVLKMIVQMRNLSSLDISTYSSVLNKYSTVTSEYKKIGFYALVTYSATTLQNPNSIVINPDENPQFNYVIKTNLLAENLLDAIFFGYIAEYRKSKIGLSSHISIVYNKEPGGGDTTVQKYEDFAMVKEGFCLAILDGDMKYPQASLGETCGKVKKYHIRNKPFNCVFGHTEDLLEVENLIPQNLYLNDPNYKNSQIVTQSLSFDMSFFDLKEGLKYRKLGNQHIRDYWRTVLSKYKDLLECIDLSESVSNSCNNSEEFCKVCGEDRIIDGFGSKLFDRVLSTQHYALSRISDSDLTKSQITEWNKIGDLVLKWCCATKLHKNPLFAS